MAGYIGSKAVSVNTTSATISDDLAVGDDATVAGDATVTGVITGSTLEATGDTAAGDNAAIGYTAAEGLILTGQGSTGDITIKNDADAVVLQVPTGTTNVNVIGSIDVATNAVIDGTALVTGVLTTTAATVFNGGFASNADSTIGGTVTITSNTPVLTFIESDQSNKQYQVGSFGSAFAINDGTNSQFRYIIDANGNHTFNEGGVDCDFRVESADATHAFFVSGAGEAIVGIGQSSPTSPNGATDFLHIGRVGIQDCSIVLQDAVEIWEIYQNDDLMFRFDTTSVLTLERVSGNVIIENSGGTLQTATAGTSNFRAGENAGNSIAAEGGGNTVVGDEAGTAITTGDGNVALGFQALDASQAGGYNVAIGERALSGGNLSATGGYNTAIGHYAGFSLTGAVTLNTFLGSGAGHEITSGAKNTIIGAYDGDHGGLDIRTASNNIVLSDGDGVAYFFANRAGFEAGGTPARGTSTSIHKTINRGAGNTSETFTAAQMGMSDNCTAMIFISVGGNTNIHAYGQCVVAWYMPRGAASNIQANVVTLYKGSGVTTFARAVSSNSLVVTKDSGLPVSVQVIGGGGTSDPN